MEILRKQNESILILNVTNKEQEKTNKEQEKKISKMQSTFEEEKSNNSIKYEKYNTKHEKYDGIMNKAIGYSVGVSIGGTSVLAACAKLFGLIH